MDRGEAYESEAYTSHACIKVNQGSGPISYKLRLRLGIRFGIGLQGTHLPTHECNDHLWPVQCRCDERCFPLPWKLSYITVLLKLDLGLVELKLGLVILGRLSLPTTYLIEGRARSRQVTVSLALT